MKTNYQSVSNFPGYRVGDDGSVWSCWRRKRKPTGYGGFCVLGDKWVQLRPWTKKNTAYQKATLYRDGRQWRFAVHRLVLEAFVGPCPPGYQCLHADDDPSNNHLNNLSWGTRADNDRDKVIRLRMPRGSGHCKAKFVEADILVVRSRLASGEKQADIAKDYGVSQPAISSINCRETWKHVT